MKFMKLNPENCPLKTLVLTISLMSALWSPAQTLQWVDTTNVHANVIHTNIGYFTIPGVITNAPVQIVLTNASIGDALPLAFGKLNTNFTSTATAITNAVNGGHFYPSNTFNLYSVTNGLLDKGIWQGSSNGEALVTLQVTNGVVRYLQTLR